MKNKRTRPIPPELAEEHDEHVTDAVRLARGQLTPERAQAVRDRMATDEIYRAVVEPILDAYQAPPMAAEEIDRAWQEFQHRAGLALVESHDSDLADFEARVRAREGRWRRRILGVAAGFFILMALPISYWVYAGVAFYRDYGTTANVTSTISLPDGSVATLAPSSELRHWKGMVNKGGHVRRDVYLTGTADFVVTNFADARFSVDTKHARVTAVGTRFRVEEHTDFTRVVVAEGSVTVQALDAEGNLTGQAVPFGGGGTVRVLPPAVLAEAAPVPPAGTSRRSTP